MENIIIACLLSPELIYNFFLKDKAKTPFVLGKICHLHLAYDIQLGTNS